MSRKSAFVSAIAILAVLTGMQGVAFALARPPKDHGKSPAPSASAPRTPTPTPQPKPTPTPVAINQNAQAIVLGYHRIVSKVRHPDTEITAADFENQMQQLKDQGIRVIPLQQMLAWKRNEKDIPPQSAVLTFDDGWKSQYEVAWPILKKYGYPFTMFIYTDYIRGGPKSGGESISWEQLAEMRDAGVDIQGHTVSHHDLTKKPRTAQFPTYDEWLWNELNGSKQMLEKHLGIKVNTLAVPYGRYNAEVQKVAKEAGYEAIFTVYGQKIGHSVASDALGRYMIEANKPRIFASALQFNRPAGEAPAAVAEFTGSTVPTQPADGATINDRQPAITANLEQFGLIDPATLSMRISGLGKVNATFDARTKTFSYKPETKLPESAYTIIVSGDSKGMKQQLRWSFNVKAVPAAKTGPATVQPTGATSNPSASPSPIAK